MHCVYFMNFNIKISTHERASFVFLLQRKHAATFPTMQSDRRAALNVTCQRWYEIKLFPAVISYLALTYIIASCTNLRQRCWRWDCPQCLEWDTHHTTTDDVSGPQVNQRSSSQLLKSFVEQHCLCAVCLMRRIDANLLMNIESRLTSIGFLTAAQTK